MNYKRTMLLILIALLWSGSLSAQQAPAVRVAVMPFDIFSMEEMPNLGKELSIQLAQQMALNPRIFTCSYEVIAAILQNRKDKRLHETALAEIAQALNAQFIVFGSMTKIQNDMSIDVQLFNSAEKGAYFKAFAEGTVLDVLIRTIAQKLEPEIMKKALLSEPQQPDASEEAPRPEPPEELLAEEAEKQPPPAEQELPSGAEENGATTSAPPPASIEKSEMPAQTPSAAAPEQPVAEEERARVAAVPSGEDKKPPRTADEAQKKRGPLSFGSNLPVNINADTLEYDNKRNMVAFKGHVVARQGDMVIFADAMNVTYETQGKLRQIEARGGVKIIQGDRIATGDVITYYNEEQKIVLTGNPRVWQGDNVINGEKITVFIKEERSIVEGSTANRVSATIVPKKKGQKTAP
jgi:lipopolysaccharide export system protein LptA